MTPAITENTLTLGEYTEPLPHLPQAATVHVWSVPTEYRDSGYFVSVQAHGEPQQLPACDAAAASLLATLELPASEAAQLAAAQSERLAATNAEADRLLAELSASYPEREVISWDQQVKEAEALQGDPDATTPLLRALAAARGVDPVMLAIKVLAKRDDYAIASGTILGARQRVEDQLAAADAESLADVPTLSQILTSLAAA